MVDYPQGEATFHAILDDKPRVPYAA
jgi:hypothetical protein